MRHRFVFSILMLGLGATLLAAAGLSSASSTARRGGILRFTLYAGIVVDFVPDVVTSPVSTN